MHDERVALHNLKRHADVQCSLGYIQYSKSTKPVTAVSTLLPRHLHNFSVSTLSSTVIFHNPTSAPVCPLAMLHLVFAPCHHLTTSLNPQRSMKSVFTSYSSLTIICCPCCFSWCSQLFIIQHPLLPSTGFRFRFSRFLKSIFKYTFSVWEHQ